MMEENGINNITKKMARDWMRAHRYQYSSDDIAKLIYDVTVEEKEYYRENDPYMSYICRAYNITAYHADRKQNCIRGRYKEYIDKAEDKKEEQKRIKDLIEWIVEHNKKGFSRETPRFDDLIRDYYLPKEKVSGQKYQDNVYDGNVIYYSEDDIIDGGIYALGMFGLALLVRWFFAGTIWGEGFRKFLTLLMAFFVLAGCGIGLKIWERLRYPGGKSTLIVGTILALGLIFYSVCNYPGHWISRIITGAIGIFICIILALPYEDL